MPNKFPKKVRRGWVTKRACNGRSDKGEIGGKTATSLLLLTPSPIPASSVYCFPNIVNIRSLIEMQIRFKWL